MSNTHNSHSYRSLPAISKFYIVSGVILCLCFIAAFIVWIVNANKINSQSETIIGISFLTMTVGALWYLLTRPRHYLVANVGLWVGIIACVVLMFVALAI